MRRRLIFGLVGTCIALALYLSGVNIHFVSPTESAALSSAQHAALQFALPAQDSHPQPLSHAGRGESEPAPLSSPHLSVWERGAGGESLSLPQPQPATTATPSVAPTVPTPDAEVTMEPADEPIMPSQAVAPGAEPAEMSLEGLPSDVTNILVMGSDRRSKADPGRTDVMLLLSVDRVNKLVRMLSIPRDLWVYIPGVGYNRINTAHVFGALYKKPGGGPGLVKETFKHNLGLRVDRYIVLDFNGFKDVVNTLGGVDVEVPCGLYDGEFLRLPPGRHHLDGDKALRYARSRFSTSDFSRAARQQQILRNLWEQTPKGQILLKVPQLWTTFNERVDTDLNLGELMSLGALATQIKPENIKSRVLTYPNLSAFTTAGGAAVLKLNPAGYQQLLSELYGASQITITADLAATDLAAHPVEEAPLAKVVVLNGTPRKDLAQLAASVMRDETGISAHATGTAFMTDYPKTLVLDYGAPQSDVERLTKFFSAASIRLPRPLDSDTSDVVVVIGNDYKSCRGR